MTEQASTDHGVPMERWSVEIPQDPSDWMNQIGRYIDSPEADAQPDVMARTPAVTPPDA